MRLVIQEEPEGVADYTARYIRKTILDFNPGPENYFVLGLPTGSTPILTYKKLIEFHNKGELSFKYVKTFNMDEYCGIPRDHPESYHSFMYKHLFQHIDIQAQNVHLLDGNAPDLMEECRQYEQKIMEAGGIDLFMGGVGSDGHIAFNEPGSSLVSRTRIKALAHRTIEDNKRFFGNDDDLVPKQALTVGVGTIMDARQVLILITGQNKAYALRMAVEEGISHMWTVSALQQHPKVIFVVDEDATMELRVKTYKYFKGLQHIYKVTSEKDL